MARTFDALTDELVAWIGRQPLFFVATAPLAADGHVNVSPKGLDTFRVLDPRTVAYLDLTGSGAETIAHLNENGRVTIMFCAFTGPPRILRLFGRGQVVTPDHAEWEALAGCFPDLPGARSVIRLAVERIATSCGYGVPRMDVVEERDKLIDWAERKGPDGLAAYRAEKNAASIDGLPALPTTEM